MAHRSQWTYQHLRNSPPLITCSVNVALPPHVCVCACVSPAAMSMEQKVGEPRLAARWSGVFPPNVQALTSARSWKHTKTLMTSDSHARRDALQVDVKKLRPLLCLVTSVMSRQATLNRFSLTARWRAVFPLFCSGSFILAPPSTSRRRQRSPSLLTARWSGWRPDREKHFGYFSLLHFGVGVGWGGGEGGASSHHGNRAC